MASSIAGACTGSLQVYGFGIVIVLGSFAPNGGLALVLAGVKGKGFSVAYTGTGTYTITLVNSGLSLLSSWVTPQIAANATTNTSLQLGAVDVSTALTAVIRNNPGGSVADIAANAGNRIHFGLYLATSSLNS